MMSSVSISEKRDFIKWFLKMHDLKKRECVWILNYLISHDELLKNIHFVEEAHYCPRALVISSSETDRIPFRFYKGNIMTTDTEKSFHDLRLHPNEEMFIQLNFPNQHQAVSYLSVLEENPFIPPHKHVSIQDKQNAKKWMDETLRTNQKEMIQNRIDQALDENDRESFLELSILLKKLNEEM